MKFKKYKCIDCDFTCMIEVIPDGAYTLPPIAHEHISLNDHSGFVPIEEDGK